MWGRCRGHRGFYPAAVLAARWSEPSEVKEPGHQPNKEEMAASLHSISLGRYGDLVRRELEKAVCCVSVCRVASTGC